LRSFENRVEGSGGGNAVSLTNVWLQTHSDGLVRADQVVGLDVHQTPALPGKAPHWLLDVVLPASIGSGAHGEWDVTVLHRTLAQTGEQPGDAAAVLARMLADLDAVDAAGIITTSRRRAGAGHVDPEPAAVSVQFRFVPFPSSEPQPDGELASP
jgi:hypothetical protein